MILLLKLLTCFLFDKSPQNLSSFVFVKTAYDCVYVCVCVRARMCVYMYGTEAFIRHPSSIPLCLIQGLSLTAGFADCPVCCQVLPPGPVSTSAALRL